MRGRSTITGVIFIATTLCGASALARHVHPKNDEEAGRDYDTRNVVAFNGAVTAVHGVTHRGTGPEVHLTIKTDNGTVDVRLGPVWYVDQQGIHIKAGDRVAIVGSRISIDHRPGVLAAEVRKGGDMLELRDVTTGAPRWQARAAR